MKRRKLAGVLLALLLVMSCLPTASAAGEGALALSSGQVKAGDRVTLTVSLRDNPGMATFLLYVYYDTSVFTVDPTGDISAAGIFRQEGGLICNAISTAKANGRYGGDAGKDGVLALWYNSSGVDTTGSGDMLTVTLHARSGAANGDYTVSLGYSATDTRDESGAKVALRTASATVTVSGGSNAQTGGEVQQPGQDTQGETETPQFLDVAGHWAESYIEQAAARGLIVGYQGLYRPGDTMTRAECVTILYRASGSPKTAGTPSFTDLDPQQSWYWNAVAWAEQNGVVNGVGNGRFDPNGSVTREQLATILHRLSGRGTGTEALLTQTYDASYSDSASVSAWAKPSLYWTIYNGIYCGTASAAVGSSLAPAQAADRAQIAVMIVRYLQQ